MKHAFTMAEVLITLGIVGVIAAITIPNVVQNYKKKDVAIKLQKNYNELNQVIERAKADHGDPESWNYWEPSNLDKWVETYIVPYVRTSYSGTNDIMKFCTYNMSCDDFKPCGNCSTTGGYWVVKSAGSSAVAWRFNNYGQYPNGVWYNSIRVNVYMKKTKIYGKPPYTTFRPVMLGREIFSFELPYTDYNQGIGCGGKQNKFKFMPFSYCSSESALLGTMWGGCNKSASGGGYRGPGEACGALIMKNNWKVPDNYPIKF